MTEIGGEELAYAQACIRARLARWRSVPGEDRRDAAQAALVAVWRAWVRFSPKRGSWKTYIDRVAAHAVSNERRRAYRRLRVFVAAPLPPAADTFRRSIEDSRALALALPDAELRRLALMRLAGRTHAQCREALHVGRARYGRMLEAIAEALGCPPRVGTSRRGAGGLG